MLQELVHDAGVRRAGSVEPEASRKLSPPHVMMASGSASPNVLESPLASAAGLLSARAEDSHQVAGFRSLAQAAGGVPLGERSPGESSHRRGSEVHNIHGPGFAGKETSFIRTRSSNVRSQTSVVSNTSDAHKADSELRELARSLIMQPLGTTVAHASLQRATPPCSILAGMGKQLRMTSGGIGVAGTKADDALYAMSRQATVIDGFLSHSWHASWFLKYLVLLFYFNSWAATFVILTLGLVTTLWSLTAETLFESVFLGGIITTPTFMTWTNFSGLEQQEFECPATEQYRLFALPIGAVVFVSVLTNWHWVAKLSHRLGPLIFFDKVCIHQTEPELKEAGIKSIGGILQNSRELLLAWDSSYFQRLWCTYELSAFLHKQHQKDNDEQKPREGANITVIPVQLGGVIFAVLIGNTVICFMAWMQAVLNPYMPYSVRLDPYGSIENHPGGFIVWELIRLLPLMVTARWVRKYLRHLAKMDAQITMFSVESAKCFCCTVNHINPENGQRMSCDRILVEDGIANLFNSRGRRHTPKQQALEDFENDVRFNVRKAMKTSLGKRSHIPYKFACLLGIPFVLSELDFRSSFENTEPFNEDNFPLLKTLYVIHVLMLQWPFGWFVFQNVISWGVIKKRSGCVNRIIFFLLGITAMASWLFIELTSMVAIKCGKFYWFPMDSILEPNTVRFTWVAFEAMCVAYIYKPPWIRRCCPKPSAPKDRHGRRLTDGPDINNSIDVAKMDHQRQMRQDVFSQLRDHKIFVKRRGTQRPSNPGRESTSMVEMWKAKPGRSTQPGAGSSRNSTAAPKAGSSMQGPTASVTERHQKGPRPRHNAHRSKSPGDVSDSMETL